MEEKFNYIHYVSDATLVEMLTEYFNEDNFAAIQLKQRNQAETSELFEKRAKVLGEAIQRIKNKK